MMQAVRWPRGCVVALAVCLLVLLVACPVGIVGVRQGVVKPPWFDRMLGPVRLVGYTTWNVNCPPYTGCDPTLHEAYVVWIVIQPADSAHNRSVYRFVRVPIKHEPVDR